MPELPEVETVVRDLRTVVLGKRLSKLEMSKLALRRPWQPRQKKHILGRTVQTISRRGKWIIFDLDGPHLLIHLGMTGQLTVVPAEETCRDHTHFIFTLAEGHHELRFRDVRRFGSISYFADRDTLEKFFQVSGLGPEPFAVEPTYWQQRLAETKRSLKAVLLDQTVLAGVGNIYADEALFEAKLHPTWRGCDLPRRRAETLRLAVVTVLERAIERRGSTIRDYIGGSGLKGQMQREFRVYGRTGQACLRCGGPIALMRLAGRSTHFCPRCQKAP